MPYIPGYTELQEGSDPGSGIEAVWSSVARTSGLHRVLPDGRCDIILRFRDTPTPIGDICPVVTAPTCTFYDVPVQPGMGFVGVRLRPGYFRSVLGFRPGALRGNALVGAAALSACPPLASLCAEATSAEDLAKRLAAFVRLQAGHATPSRQTRQVLGAIHSSAGRLAVDDIARMHGLSARSVQRIVQDAIGLAPKTYARILQFHRALRLIRDHGLTLTDAAHEAGYADQAHMSHAFRQLGGFSPAGMSNVTLVTLHA